MAGKPTPESLWDFDLRLFAGGPGVGCDEAGRGPLAGPVVAAAVLFPGGARPELGGLRDSKALAASRREGIRAEARRLKLRCALGWASVREIDELNILRASQLAMKRAVERLAPPPSSLVAVDGNRLLRDFPLRQTAVVKGDDRSWSVALASILAKVARDRWMRSLSRRFPGYGWESNKGYGTAAHLEALGALGPCDLHRRSFAPVAGRPA